MLIHGEELVVHPDYHGLQREFRRVGDVLDKYATLPPGPIFERSVVKKLELPQGRFFLKVYAYRGAWRLRTFAIQARARREYRNLLRLAELGFHVPAAVAYGQRRTFGFVSVSFLLTSAVERAVELRTLIDAPAASPFPLPSPAERRSLIEGFARTLRHAHERRFFIHTLRFKNLLLAREEERYVLYVIDVPFAGIWRWRFFPTAGRVRDLAVLMRGARRLLSRTERMRFARAYGADRELLRRAQAYQERHYP